MNLNNLTKRELIDLIDKLEKAIARQETTINKLSTLEFDSRLTIKFNGTRFTLVDIDGSLRVEARAPIRILPVASNCFTLEIE